MEIYEYPSSASSCSLLIRTRSDRQEFVFPARPLSSSKRRTLALRHSEIPTLFALLAQKERNFRTFVFDHLRTLTLCEKMRRYLHFFLPLPRGRVQTPVPKREKNRPGPANHFHALGSQLRRIRASADSSRAGLCTKSRVTSSRSRVACRPLLCL
jgi:hypothetical protein